MQDTQSKSSLLKPTRHAGPSMEGIVLLVLLSFLTSTLVSTGLFVYRMDHPDTLTEYFPPQTYSRVLFLIAVTVLLLLLFVLHLTLQLRLAKLQMPVIPTPIPFLGYAIHFINKTPWNCMLEWHQRVGDIFCYTLLGRTVVSLSDPQHIKAALQSKIKAVKKDVGFSYHPFLVILGTGIVTSEDKSWMKQRLKMSTALRITVLDIIPRATLQAVQRFMVQLDQAAETKTPVRLTEALRHLTLQVISNSFLSLEAEESDNNFAKLYLPIVDECNTRVWHPYRAYCFFMPFWWKHLYYVYRLNSYVSNLIQQRWALRISSQKRFDDILDLVLDAHQAEHGTSDSAIPLAQVRQIRDEFKTFMLAGHETSASMMTWALYEILANDDVRKQVTQEADRVLGGKRDWKQASAADLPSRERLDQLECAEACLKESLRKYSVVPLVIRRVVEQLDLGERQIPKGTTLAINIQAVHHNPKYWPDPNKFDPHRFMEKRPEPYTFLPFLEGPRNCLGQHLALLESKMVIGFLAQRYEFHMEEKPCLELFSRDDPRHRYIIPVIPNEDVKVIVTKK